MSNGKTVTVIVPELLPVPPTQGGAVEQWVHETTQRMDFEKYSIEICSRPTDESSPAPIKNIHISWTPIERFFAKIKSSVGWGNPLRYVAKMVCVALYGYRALRAADGSDIIYIHNEPNILLFLRRRPGVRVVLHMHNDHLSSRLFRPLYRQLLRKVDVVICVSDYIRNRALIHYIEHEDKFQVLLNATDPEFFKPFGSEVKSELGVLSRELEGHEVVLYVGRLVPEKGADVLIRAFAEVKVRRPNSRLVIAGSSFFKGANVTPFQRQLTKLAKDFENDIIFTGYLKHDKLRYLYSIADVFAFPATWGEPFGLVVLESMASGTCCVATSVGGVPEFMEDGVTGLLVAPGDSRALADAIDRALETPELRREWGYAARQKVCNGFTWAHLMMRLEPLLEGSA